MLMCEIGKRNKKAIIFQLATAPLIDSELIKSKLESSGIEYFIKSDGVEGVYSNLSSLHGINIMTSKQDEHVATKVINSDGQA